MIQKSISLLRAIRHKNGLFSASSLAVSTGYNRAWIRDNVYEAMGIEAVSPKEAIKTYHALLDILLKHETKIDFAIKEKPKHAYQYIHARYDPITLNEIWEEWGNKQNDSIGALIFKICDLTQKGFSIVRDRHDIRILQKLVQYLESIEYWQDKDNGVWEESEEVHASSVGACLAALKSLKKTTFKLPSITGKTLLRKISVPRDMITKGQETLNHLLPCESINKQTDLALLSLIYPYNIVSAKQKKQILENIEMQLVRNKGVIRYTGDQYYNKSGEAEWTFGLPWLAIIYKQDGNKQKSLYYTKKTMQAFNQDGELPELYYAGSETHNENTPLGWSQAMYLIMRKM
jgi:GH15 family glucan-1,4-alpha-glucosidase